MEGVRNKNKRTMIIFFLSICTLFLFSTLVTAATPVIDEVEVNYSMTPLDQSRPLNSSVNASDADFDVLKYIYSWMVNNNQFQLLNIPFERHNTTNTTNPLDYARGNRVTLFNGPIFNATGGYDGRGAYHFDGIDDGINTSHTTSIDFSNITFTAWIKTNDSSQTGAIITKRPSDGTNQLALFVCGADNCGVAGNRITSFEGGGVTRTALSTTSVSDDKWHHVALVRNNFYLSTYVDGVMEAISTVAPAGSLANTASITIGYSSGLSAFHFNGTVDEVNIYNRSLSSDQIRGLFNNQSGRLVANETLSGQNWTVDVWANDGMDDSAPVRAMNHTFVSDDIPPTLFSPIPISGTTVILFSIIEISINVTDDNTLSNVNASILLPNASRFNILLTNGTGYVSKFNASFAHTGLRGTYNITFFANDSAGNRGTNTTSFMTPPPANYDLCLHQERPGRNCTMAVHVHCGSYFYDVYNMSQLLISDVPLTSISDNVYQLTFNFTNEDSYLVRFCDNSTQTVLVKGEDEMGSLSITLFVLVITLTLFLVPFFVERFSKNKIADLIIRRSMWVVALYLMALNSAIMMTVADFAGIPVVDEMFRYLWLFGWGGYGMLLFLVVKTIMDVLDLYRQKAKELRMGEL